VNVADSAVVERYSQPVVVDASAFAGDSFGVLDLEGFGGSVGHVGVVEVGEEIRLSGGQGAAESGHLGRRAVAGGGDHLLGGGMVAVSVAGYGF
jgi:hypothetical protein